MIWIYYLLFKTFELKTEIKRSIYSPMSTVFLVHFWLTPECVEKRKTGVGLAHAENFLDTFVLRLVDGHEMCPVTANPTVVFSAKKLDALPHAWQPQRVGIFLARLFGPSSNNQESSLIWWGLIGAEERSSWWRVFMTKSNNL